MFYGVNDAPYLALANIGIAFHKTIFVFATFAGISNLWMVVFTDTGVALMVIVNGLRLMC